MTRSPTFPPVAETTTPPQTAGPAAPRPSPPGPKSLVLLWLHNHAYRRASLSPSRFPSIYRCQVDGALARIYDGVHYRNSTEVGTAMGVKTGEFAAAKYFK